jgi:hypothetical protein
VINHIWGSNPVSERAIYNLVCVPRYIWSSHVQYCKRSSNSFHENVAGQSTVRGRTIDFRSTYFSPSLLGTLICSNYPARTKGRKFNQFSFRIRRFSQTGRTSSHTFITYSSVNHALSIYSMR